MKEFFRKKMVGLKRKPQTIALVVLVAAFLYYSLNLTQISNTTAKVQGQGMGLAGFVTMLFSMLSLVCFMNAFPHRKKVNIPMLVLMFLMVGVIVYCDIYYGGRITNAITRTDNPIDPAGANSYILKAQNMLKVHMVILIVGAALTALLPVYAPLLKKVNTSIEVAGNEEMAALDLRGQDD
jgi:glucan phosphoethanolaminetransferase (alkaline phosphatase superfamily)